MVPSGNFQNGCLAFAGLSFRRVKRGITSSSKIHEAYFFDDYDIYSLGEGCGLMRDKLLAFHASTGDMPVLCGDITPRPWRVPDAPELCKHPIGRTRHRSIYLAL